jgi:acetyl esterase/lipase
MPSTRQRAAAIAVVLVSGCADVPVQTHVYDERFTTGVLDVYGATPGSALPAVMYIHGGGWQSGRRQNDEPTAERLARAGYAVANIDYRLVPDGVFPAAVQDAFCALAFVRAHADELGVDRDRIVVMGHSAGAHLAALVAVAADVPELQAGGCAWPSVEPPAAAIAVAGPMDLRQMDHEVVASFVGTTLDVDPARFAAASPITHVGSDEPPFLLVHSEHDLIVSVSQSEAMTEVLRASGNDAALLRLEGGGHVIGDGTGLGLEESQLATDTPEAWAAMLDFLTRVAGT